jgi:hypothetical protein
MNIELKILLIIIQLVGFSIGSIGVDNTVT